MRARKVTPDATSLPIAECDILIVGASAGGVAAALAAASTGATVYLIERSDWLGGQLTVQGVCTPDENRYIETFGATSRYRCYRNAVREHYRSNYHLTPQAAADPCLNPGLCWVSALSYEPNVGLAVLQEMAAPYEASGRLKILHGAAFVGCELDEDRERIAAVDIMDVDAPSDAAGAAGSLRGNGTPLRLWPKFVLDATDLGEVLPYCGIEGDDWIIGAESHAETGEPDAPAVSRPDWVQPFTFPFALEWSPETADTNVITPPPDYQELCKVQNYHVKHGAITGLFAGDYPWWSYRRLLAFVQFQDARVSRDLSMINTAGNDFYGGNVIGTTTSEEGLSLRAEDHAAETLRRARRASLGFLYWLQTEAPRDESYEDGIKSSDTDSGSIRVGKGYPEFRLKRDLFDAAFHAGFRANSNRDGCAPMPYIRESRRIRSLRPVLEQEIVVNDFQGGTCRGESARAVYMPDSVGIGHYALDIHPNGHGEPSAYVATRPFQIPLGALIPVRVTNLLPACKNLGVTHLTNGAYRLHPIEWNIGESSGLLAAFCIRNRCAPREVYADSSLLAEFQDVLLDEGIPLSWYTDVAVEHPAFRAVQRLALRIERLGRDTDLLFRPDEAISSEEWSVFRSVGRDSKNLPIGFNGSRADAAKLAMRE